MGREMGRRIPEGRGAESICIWRPLLLTDLALSGRIEAIRGF